MHYDKVKLKSGQIRWVATGDGPPDPATGKRKQIERRGKTKGEAKERVEQAIKKLEDTGYSIKQLKTKTFETIAEAWLKTYALSGVKRGSVRVREYDIAVLNEKIAKTPIDEIDHHTFQRFINSLSEKYSHNYIKSISTTAGLIFKYAKKSKLIDDNPQEDVSLPKKVRTVDDLRNDELYEKYLEHDELEQFFDSLSENALELDLERFYLLAFTGMRPGELCALQKEDLDFTNNTIRIYKTLYNEKNNMKDYALNTPKTVGSIRTIDMEPNIMKMLERLVKKNDRRKMVVRTEFSDFHDKDFLFCRPNGYPYATRYLEYRMQRILEHTDITKKATPHIFRHTHISMLTEAGVDLPTIMKRVGHEDVTTTMKVYTHVTQRMSKDAPIKLSNLHENILQKVIS